MVQLHLGRKRGSEESFQQKRKCLRTLDDLLWQALVKDEETRREAWLWLITAVSQLPPPPSSWYSRRLLGLLPDERKSTSDASRKPFTIQLLRLACEHVPEKVAALLAEDGRLIKAFFEGRTDLESEKRIKLWFDRFGLADAPLFTLGAKALSRYAIIHREKVWDLLVWAGGHPQSPISVASRPHYWSELAVVPTVERFLKDCPNFWESPELNETLQGGELLALDQEFFTMELYDILLHGGRRASALREVLQNMLRAQPFPRLCRALLPLLTEDDLLGFSTQLCPMSNHRQGTLNAVQLAVFGDANWRNMSQLLFAVSLGFNGVQVMDMLKEEDHADAMADITAAVQEVEKLEVGLEFWSWLRSSYKASRTESIRLLLVEAFVLRVRLTACGEEGVDAIREACEENEIGFEIVEPVKEASARKSKGGWTLLSSPESGSASDLESSRKDRKKRKKSKEKKKKKKRKKRQSEPALKRRRLEPMTRGAVSEGEDSEDEMGFAGFSDSPRAGSPEGIGLESRQFVLKREGWTATCSMLTIVPTLLEYTIGVWLHCLP